MNFSLEAITGWFFDLDGTLMDTDDQAVAALARRLRWLGKRRAERRARYLVMMSETPANRLLTVLDWMGLDSWLFATRRWLHRRRPEPTFEIIAGVRELLSYLAERKRLAVVSTRSHEDALAFLAQHDMTEFFELVVTQETTKRLKPHPEPVLYTAEQLGLEPEACAMVGDTPVDMISARRAGAWAVGVLCGFGEEPEMVRAGTHLLLPATADLLPLFQKVDGGK